MSGQVPGIKTVFGPDPRKSPVNQHLSRIMQLAREMKDIIGEGDDEIISRHYKSMGYSSKEFLTWTLYHIHLFEDNGTISRRERWASKKGIRILECLEVILVEATRRRNN